MRSYGSEAREAWKPPLFNAPVTGLRAFHLPDYMAVTKLRVHPEEFAKTPKKSIKRYLYMKN